MREKSVSSFKFLSKEKQKRAKTPNEEEEEAENEREKNVVQMNWITQILGLFTHYVGMPNNIHELFRFFSYFARLNFSCTIFSVSIYCLRFGCLSSMCMMVLWSFESFYILWMSRINEQNFLFAKFIKHRIHFSTIFYLFHSFLSLVRCKSHTPMHMIIVFLASITRIYRLH